MKGSYKKAMKLIFGLVIITILFTNIGIYDILGRLASINLLYLPAIVAIYVVVFIIGAFNINLLLIPIKHMRFWDIFRYYCLSWSIGLVVPGKIGEFSLVYFLRKNEDIPIGKSAAVSLMDKFITIIIMLLIASFGLFIFFDQGTATKVFLASLAFLLGAAVLVFTDLGRNLIKRFILRNHSGIFKGFSELMNLYFRTHQDIIYLNLFLTFAKYLFTSLSGYLLFLSFGIQVSFLYILVIVTTANLLSLIPITIDGLGIRESVAVFLYSKIGVMPAVVGGFYLLSLIIKYLYALVFFSRFSSLRK